MMEQGYDKADAKDLARKKDLEQATQRDIASRVVGEEDDGDGDGNGESSSAGGGGVGGMLSTGGLAGRSLLVRHRFKRDFGKDDPPYDWVPSDLYATEVVHVALDEFPFLAITDVSRVIKSPRFLNHYAPFHKAVCDAITGHYAGPPLLSRGGGGNNNNNNGNNNVNGNNVDDETVRLQEVCTEALANALAGKPLPDDAKTRLMAVGLQALKRPRKRAVVNRDTITDTDLLEEIVFVGLRQKDVQLKLDAILARKMAKEAATLSGSLVECQCCYDDFAFEEMTSCQDGHLFCIECVRRYAEEQLFGLSKTVLTCMSGSDEPTAVKGKCVASFIAGSLERALPPKVRAKYEEALFNAAVTSAGLETSKCPKCDFQALLPPTERVFRCPRKGCYYESCRDCGEPPHMPLRCSEVEKESHVEGRKNVEEAMTAARVRECPNPACRKRFYKVEGCNKMTCACLSIICYVCRGKVEATVGYKHFCQIPNCTHGSCERCPLFTNSVEDDRQAMKEAGIKAMAANAKLLQLGTGGGKNDAKETEKGGRGGGVVGVGVGGRAVEGGEGPGSGLDLDRLLEESSVPADVAERAMRAAQQAAVGGVGAMARAFHDLQQAELARRGGGGGGGGAA